MLDSISLALLNVICVNTDAFYHKVFSIEFLLGEMPKELNVNKNAVIEGLTFLTERDYISVKYQDENEACVGITQKGRLVFENKIDQEIETSQKARKYLLFAFLGSVIGSLIGALIALLITWVIR